MDSNPLGYSGTKPDGHAYNIYQRQRVGEPQFRNRNPYCLRMASPRMTAISSSALPGYSRISEPNLVFAGDNVHPHPLLGLIKFGPYGLRFGAPSNVRIAALAPASEMPKLRGLIAELE